MAKKALFHTVYMRNGHEEWWQIVPAQSAEHAKSYFETNDIAATNVECNGWCVVEPDWDGSNVVFNSQVGNHSCYFEPGIAGYDFLRNHFHVVVKQIEQDVRNMYYDSQ